MCLRLGTGLHTIYLMQRAHSHHLAGKYSSCTFDVSSLGIFVFLAQLDIQHLSFELSFLKGGYLYSVPIMTQLEPIHQTFV